MTQQQDLADENDRLKAALKRAEEARSESFEYIKVFYNRRRRHSHLGQLSPADEEEKANLNELNEWL